MNKLPFVWELKYEGVVSHTIGSPKGITTISPEHYIKDIVNYLDGKKVVFVEPTVIIGTLDNVIVDIANDVKLRQKLRIEINTTEVERKAVSSHYSHLVNTKEAADAYKSGNETELKKMYGKLTPSLNLVNKNIVIRSLHDIGAEPTLLVANLAHFVVEPSLVKMYEEKKIEIKRVQ